MRRILQLLVAVAASLWLTASPSLAATSSWTKTVNSADPAIYLFNTLYSGAMLTPTTAPPTGATISNLSYSWSVNGSLMGSAIPTGSTLQVWICANGNTSDCINVSGVGSVMAWSGSSTAFNGRPTTTNFKYFYRLYKPGVGQQALQSAFWNKSYGVTVDYIY